MRLTIVIPTIGRPELERAIDSVQNQTVDTQILVETDERRRGAGPTRNLALKRVTSPWVGFCDDDDELDENYHKWLDEACEGFDVVIFKMKNQPNGGIPYTTNVDELRYNEVGMSYALKTDLARKYPFKNMIGEDFDQLQRIIKDGHKVKVVDKVAYYLHGRNGTN